MKKLKKNGGNRMFAFSKFLMHLKFEIQFICKSAVEWNEWWIIILDFGWMANMQIVTDIFHENEFVCTTTAKQSEWLTVKLNKVGWLFNGICQMLTKRFSHLPTIQCAQIFHPNSILTFYAMQMFSVQRALVGNIDF